MAVMCVYHTRKGLTMPKIIYVVPYGVNSKTNELLTRGFRNVERALKYARKKNMEYIFAKGENYMGRIHVPTGEVFPEVRTYA